LLPELPYNSIIVIYAKQHILFFFPLLPIIDACRTSESPDEPDIDQLSFTELRDKLLALDPLNKDYVVEVNKAEAEYWKKSEGYRVGWSDEILGFDCGGQQWVSETCFPAGTLANPSMKDLEYMEELKKLIERENVPAPAPIEQRWTARSRSLMSPAWSSQEDDIFSWVAFFFQYVYNLSLQLHLVLSFLCYSYYCANFDILILYWILVNVL
ncbi:L-galactono-1,4-lactone dehydrogenase 2, mitochondrial-like, partial [Dendrobium catenatum]|uniref:L-galactono-1,4-lactone dehydrogenase 2, mitochondrial-like n=1 Tax=Dendrobium catenatum TaxID=906689 RepID=UPI0010A0ABD3